MNKKTISLIGGDSRQIYTAEQLQSFGYNVSICACEHYTASKEIKTLSRLEQAFEADYIVLPLPVTKNGKLLNTPLSSEVIELKRLIALTENRNTIFLGMAPETVKKQFAAVAKEVIDYFDIEELTLKNALLTAEGIVGIISEKLPITIFNMKIAITGYGRISSYLSGILSFMGADITVFARNKVQRAKAQTAKLKTGEPHQLIYKSGEFDCIINTVPSPVITENMIAASKHDCLFIEAASAPYGIDFSACEKYNRNLIKAFSLPGKKSPKSAGRIIGEAINDKIAGDKIGKA